MMSDEFVIVDCVLDAKGLRCPEPVMLLRKMIRQMRPGEVLYIVADDLASVRDIPNYCLHMDHQLLRVQTKNSPFEYWICKGP